VRLGVAYGSPARLVEKLMLQAVAEQPEVLRDPQPIVVFEDFGDNALIFEAFFWCESTSEKELRQIRSEIRFCIDELFAEHGLVIAFPQRDVHLYTHSPIDVALRNTESRPTPGESNA